VLPYVLIGMTVGVITEACAWFLKLWVYRQPQTPVLNIIVVYGLVMGAIAALVPRSGVVPCAVMGGAVGLAYEATNLAFLKWWDFPGERLGFIRGHAAILVLLTVGWGVVPLMTAGVVAALPRSVRVEAPRQSALEKLNEREQQLIRKLDAVRQRVGDLESRLADVRRRKQRVLDTPAVRKAVRREERPDEN
jgi:hypothetical protein